MSGQEQNLGNEPKNLLGGRREKIGDTHNKTNVVLNLYNTEGSLPKLIIRQCYSILSERVWWPAHLLIIITLAFKGGGWRILFSLARTQIQFILRLVVPYLWSAWTRWEATHMEFSVSQTHEIIFVHLHSGDVFSLGLPRTWICIRNQVSQPALSFCFLITFAR